VRALKWLVTLPWRVIRYPFRLYRRKISVQLIFSHVMVVMLSIILLEAAIIGIAIALFREFEDDAFTEYSIAEFASSAAIVMAADPAVENLGGGEPMTTVERDRLDAALTALASQESTEAIDIQIGVNTDPPQTQLGLIDHAVVTDASGTVVVSSDDAWARPGEPVERVEFPLVGDVTRRVIARNGAPDANDVLYVIDAVDRVTVASHPLIVDGQMVGVLTLQSDPIEIPAFAEFAAGIAVANGFILVAIGLPALIVSIPVGIWRAHRLSKRLSDLADTATAMGDGDLSRRVAVRGHDEVTRVSERFNDMVDRLQTTDQARKSFVANVSHELRTPVSIIQGNLERLIADGDSNGDTPEQRRTLEMLHQETLTLSRLIDDLFTMARIEETTLPLETTSLRLHEIASDVVDGIREVAWEQRRVSVESLVPADLPPVIADRTRLRQVLGNLLYNALRHTPEGGLIVVNAEREDGMMRVSVSDTGVGISEEELARVFDRFYQVERAGRHAEGSGLGLSIVKQLVEAQGGTISAESVAGQGTTFRFTLPLAPVAQASAVTSLP
jgi:signal transduction histidine kinase